MAVKKVVRMGHPVFREMVKPLSKEEILFDETKALVQDMFDTMEAEEGIGIAAPQIGISKQIALVGVPADSERYPESEETPLYVVINPKIKNLTEEEQGFWEGCLSVPGMRGFVERPAKIQYRGYDELGMLIEREAAGFHATVFQHELDHLDGVLYIDKVKDTTKISYNEEFAQFQSDE